VLLSSRLERILRPRSHTGGRHELGQNFLIHRPTLQRLATLAAATALTPSTVDRVAVSVVNAAAEASSGVRATSSKVASNPSPKPLAISV
jgi:hypothetical protein